MMQQYVNGKGFKGPSEADQKVIDEARKKNEFMAVANPDAKEFEPRDKTPWIKTPSVSFKTPLVIYKKREQDVTCEYCLAGALPNHQPSVWTKCKNNSYLNNSSEGNVSTKMSGASFDKTYWPEEVDHMDVAPYSYEEYCPEYLAPASPGNSSPGNSSSSNAYWLEGQEVDQNLTNLMDLDPYSYEEYYPEYLAPASPGNSSSSNVYWLEGQEVDQNLTNLMDLDPYSYEEYYPEYLVPASPGNSSSSNAYWMEWKEVAQMDLTNPMNQTFLNALHSFCKSYYNQITYFSLNEKQNTEDYSSPMQSSPGFWYNNTLYF